MVIITALSAPVSLEIPKGANTVNRSILLTPNMSATLNYFEYLAVESEISALVNQGILSLLNANLQGTSTLQCDFVLDSGNPAHFRSFKGTGVKSATWITTGTYKFVLSTAWSAYWGGSAGFVSPPGATSYNDGSFPTTAPIVITGVGTTNWHAAGLDAGLTPAVGIAFLAANAGGAGTGTAVSTEKASGGVAIEVIGNANLTIVNPADPYIMVHVFDKTGALTDPVDNSVFGLQFVVS